MKNKFREEILDDAKERFNNLYNFGKHELHFSKGFPEYEYIYECCKNDLEEMGYERIEEDKIGYILVTIKKKEDDNERTIHLG